MSQPSHFRLVGFMLHELGGEGCKRDFVMKRVLCWCCCLLVFFFLTKTESERCGESSGMSPTNSVVPRSPDEITAQVRGHKSHPGSAFSGQLRRYQAPTRRKRTKEAPFLQSHRTVQAPAEDGGGIRAHLGCQERLSFRNE